MHISQLDQRRSASLHLSNPLVLACALVAVVSAEPEERDFEQTQPIRTRAVVLGSGIPQPA